MTIQFVNMPAAEYHAVKALSNSGISKLLDIPAKFKAWLDGETDEQTEAMLIGSAFHCMALEPEQFKARYHVMENSGATKAGKDEKALAAAEGKTIITRRQYEEAVPLVNALHRHGMIHRLITDSSSIKEYSLFWEEEIDGVTIPCKARPDDVTSVERFGHIILDLKSMQNAAPASQPKTILDRGYHRQAWWYMRGLYRAAGIEAKGFYLAAVEKSPPWLPALVEVESAAIEQGGRECLKAMRLYAECTKSGHWPGYPETVIKVDLPDWFYRKEMNNETYGQPAE